MEYEYSFKVTDLVPFIEYIEKNNFNKIESNYQERTLYKNDNGTMGRITIDNNKDIYLDFKEDNDNNDVLKIRKETLPIKVDSLELAKSVIDFFEYKKAKILKRTRTIYQKDDVKFEIDSYESPEIMYVVAMEGNKENVDNIYNQIKLKLGIYFK